MKKFRVSNIPLELNSLEIEGFVLDSRYTKAEEIVYDLNFVYAGWGIAAIHPDIPEQNIFCKLELTN